MLSPGRSKELVEFVYFFLIFHCKTFDALNILQNILTTVRYTLRQAEQTS